MNTTNAETRARRRNMTQAEQLADMSPSELFQIARGGTDLERCCIIEALQPDWRI